MCECKLFKEKCKREYNLNGYFSGVLFIVRHIFENVERGCDVQMTQAQNVEEGENHKPKVF